MSDWRRASDGCRGMRGMRKFKRTQKIRIKLADCQ